MRRVKILEMQVGVVIKRDFGGDGTSNILTVAGDTGTYPWDKIVQNKQIYTEYKDNWGNLSKSGSGLNQCKRPGCDVTLQFCKMLPLGETAQSTWKMNLHLSQKNLQLSQ